MDDLAEVLTIPQRRKLAEVLRAAIRTGHGEVRIRIAKGKPRFIGLYQEQEFVLDDTIGLRKNE